MSYFCSLQKVNKTINLYICNKSSYILFRELRSCHKYHVKIDIQCISLRFKLLCVDDKPNTITLVDLHSLDFVRFLYSSIGPTL